jgi:hypothetical protein
MKKVLSLIFGIGIFFVFLTSFSYAQFYELCYPGNAFTPSSNSVEYHKHIDGYLYLNGPHQFNYPVIFPASANGKKVSRLSVTYLDNVAGGYIRVALYKLDRWSGDATEVGILSSSSTGSSPFIFDMNLPKGQMKTRGIDNNRYAWYLYGYMSGFGENLRLYQVTVRYQ